MIEVKREIVLKDKCGWTRTMQLYSNGKRIYKVTKDGFDFFIKQKADMERFCAVFYGVLTQHFLEGMQQNFTCYRYDVAVEGKYFVPCCS